MICLTEIACIPAESMSAADWQNRGARVGEVQAETLGDRFYCDLVTDALDDYDSLGALRIR